MFGTAKSHRMSPWNIVRGNGVRGSRNGMFRRSNGIERHFTRMNMFCWEMSGEELRENSLWMRVYFEKENKDNPLKLLFITNIYLVCYYKMLLNYSSGRVTPVEHFIVQCKWNILLLFAWINSKSIARRSLDSSQRASPLPLPVDCLMYRKIDNNFH